MANNFKTVVTNDNNKGADIWADERNVTISVATRGDIKELKQFTKVNFNESEPTNKCIETNHGYSPLDVYLRYIYGNIVIDEPIIKNENGIKCSLIARNKDTKEIVGCIIDAIYSREEEGKVESLPNWIHRLASFTGHHKLNCLVNYEALCKDLHYSHKDAFNDIPEASSVCFNELILSRRRY